MTVDRSDLCVVEVAIEAPHVVYPKGPIRKIKEFYEAEDQVAGLIVLATLECTHRVTLLGDITETSIVRCPMCFYEKRNGRSETVIDNDQKTG